jgi:hypothetical protein
MTSKRQLSIGLLAVGLTAAGVWWLSGPDGRHGPAHSAEVPAEAQKAPAEPSPRGIVAAREAEDAVDSDPAADDGEPIAAPLPREEVVLPEKLGTADGGVASGDPASNDERRDQMLGVVLDRLQEDLHQAKDAGDEERAAQLQIRIDRLEARRSALKEP